MSESGNLEELKLPTPNARFTPIYTKMVVMSYGLQWRKDGIKPTWGK
jgi:hypothetical protein